MLKFERHLVNDFGYIERKFIECILGDSRLLRHVFGELDLNNFVRA